MWYEDLHQNSKENLSRRDWSCTIRSEHLPRFLISTAIQEDHRYRYSAGAPAVSFTRLLILNKATVTVSHKKTKVFFWKMKLEDDVGLEQEVEESEPRLGVSLPLFNLLLLQKTNNGWWQQFKSIRSIFAGTHLLTPGWNQTPQLMIGINQHKQALQSCFSVPLCKSLLSG